MRLDNVGVVLPVVVVEVLEEFLLADDFARVMEEVLEDVVLGGREVDKDAGAMDSLLERVEFNVEGFEGWVSSAFAATDEDFGASDEFAEVEGLGEVVVCAGVQQLDDCVFAFFRGEDENGGRVFAGAHAAEEAVAIELGEHEIEDDEVVAEIAGCVVAGFSVGGPVDGESGPVAEGGGEIVGEADLVFYEQHAHGGSLHREIMDATRLNGAEAGSVQRTSIHPRSSNARDRGHPAVVGVVMVSKTRFGARARCSKTVR